MDVITLASQPGAYAGASMDSSEELIARACRGDEEAFRLIFERYTRPVISFIFYMVGQRELAEELAQETFIRAFMSIHKLRSEAKLSTWLFGIAKNVSRESLRSRRTESHHINRSAASDIHNEDASPVKQMLEKELGNVMRRALDQLDEEKRLVFTLKVYQQLSYEEIAEVTGFSLPKIRNDLYRSRAALRRLLSPYLGGER